jgi:hypothetical protein
VIIVRDGFLLACPTSCDAMCITAADLLLTMTTALAAEPTHNVPERVDPRRQPRCGLRRSVRGMDKRLESCVGALGEGSDNGSEVGVHPIAHRD